MKVEMHKCLYCRGSGWYIVPNNFTGEAEQEQCAYCQGQGTIIDEVIQE